VFPRTTDIHHLPILQTSECICMLTSWRFTVADSTPNPPRHWCRCLCICNMSDVSKYSPWWLPYYGRWLCRDTQLYHLLPHNQIIATHVFLNMSVYEISGSHPALYHHQLWSSYIVGYVEWSEMMAESGTKPGNLSCRSYLASVPNSYRINTRGVLSSVVAIFAW
jgi:hypothetical protein